MKFRRRPDLDSVTRLQMAVQAFVGLGVYGEITRIASQYNVSRLFVYKLLWALLAVFALETTAAAKEAERREVDLLMLLLRLQGRCSIGNISEILRHLGTSFQSIGYISERLRTFARALPPDLPAGTTVTFYLCDEIFARSQPILVTVEARSLAILKMELVPRRDAEHWKEHLEGIETAGCQGAQGVASDLAKGILKACEWLGLSHHPDLFHLVRPLARLVARWERQAYAAIEKEEKRRQAFEKAKSEETLNKRLEPYERAQAEAAEAIQRYDQMFYLWQLLRQALDLFDAEGQLKDPSKTREEVQIILDLMGDLKSKALDQAIDTMKKGLDDYWGYVDRAEAIVGELAQICPPDLLQTLCLAWQYERHATNSKYYHIQQAFKREAQFYLAVAQSLDPTACAPIKETVFERLDANIRSSSLVENINSMVRDFLNGCRGQVTQEMLDLVAYYHNHRRFVRGKRRGQAPIEILTGQRLETSWVDSLLALVH